jgi:hypothetical protein
MNNGGIHSRPYRHRSYLQHAHLNISPDALVGHGEKHDAPLDVSRPPSKAAVIFLRETAGNDLPPKPKWMRWRTYNQYVERYDAYEDILDQGTFALVVKPMGRS